MLLFADNVVYTVPAVVSESLQRMLEPAVKLARLAGGHCGRQIYEPVRIGGKARHYLQSGSRVVLVYAYRRHKRRIYIELSAVIAYFQYIPGLFFRIVVYGLYRLIVSFERVNTDIFSFRVSVRRQLSAENTACIYAAGAVLYAHVSARHMTVNDKRLSSVVGCPVEPYGKPELVSFPRSLAVKTEIAYARRGSAYIFLSQSRVSYNELSVVKHIMADKRIEKALRLFPVFVVFCVYLRPCYVKAVRIGNVSAAKIFQQLHVVVSGDSHSAACSGHGHNEIESVRVPVSSVTEIAEEYRSSVFRVGVNAAVVLFIAELFEQQFKLRAAAVNIAYDIERSVLVTLVVPELFADYLYIFELLLRVYHIYEAKALVL